MKFLIYIFISATFLPQLSAQELIRAVPTNSAQSNQLEENVQEDLEIETTSPSSLKKVKSASNSETVTKAQKVQQYSKALRNFNRVEHNSNQKTHQRNPTTTEQQQLEKALIEMEDAQIFGVDYYLAQYKVGNYDLAKLTYLEQAYKIDAANKEVIKQLVGAYFIQENGSALDEKLLEMKKRSVFNADYYAYAQDVVVGLKQNATLISHGENDTYPLIKVLKEQNRVDVTLINLDFLQSDAYKRKLIQKGYKLPNRNLIDAEYLTLFCSLNSSKNIQIAFSVPKNYLVRSASSLYVSGLTFQYSKSQQEVFTQNLNFYNRVKESELLKSKSTLSKQLQNNYLPSLLLVKKGYLQQKNSIKAKQVDTTIQQIAQQSNKQKELNKAE